MVLTLGPLFKLEPGCGHWGKGRSQREVQDWSEFVSLEGVYLCPVHLSSLALVEGEMCLLQASTVSPLLIQYLSDTGT